MRHLVIVLLLALCLPTMAGQAQNSCPGVFNATGFDKEQLTVSSTAQVLTSSKYRSGTDSRFWAKMATISTEGDALRYWDDGSVPTASVGHKIPADTQFIVCGQLSLRNLQMIRVSGDVTIFVSYYR